MPSVELTGKDTLILKLANGYNVGIEKKEIKKTIILTKGAEKKDMAKKEPAKQSENKIIISILHTGGTISSKVDYNTGGVTAKFSESELLNMFPELAKIAKIRSRLIRKMMSENMRFEHYNLIAKAVDEEIKKGTNGIILCHGTDTLHYSSAALAFVLENISVPMLLVGAQRSSDRGSSDAALNLINAAYFISKTDFAEVAICMHENSNDENCLILPGTKTRKMHTSRRDAFRPINCLPFARVNYNQEKIEYLREDYVKKSNKKLNLKLFNPKLKVGLLKTHTHMYTEEFSAYESFDGLVVETTGLGQIPNTLVDEYTIESKKIIDTVEKLARKMPVVAAPQTIYGKLNMYVYSEGRVNLNAGMIGNYSDMTPETTFIKLAWVLSNFPKEKAKEMMLTNLRGEFSDRLLPEMFLY